MFTGVAQKNMAVAKSYFDEHLSHNDYYTQGEVEPGRWIGLGGEHLGLIEGQPVDRDVFMSLCEGLHPTDGTKLTQRLNGAGNRRVFYDFTCSAPKSVSIMAVTMNDERILRAHQHAARFAAKELERFAATRIRINGADEDRRTGNVVGAEFLHNSSRALDPQLHTHFTMFNATFDPKERRWKALQTADIFAASKYGTEVYRNELARRLSAIGYEVEARTHGFEIKGVPPSLIKKFSKRSAERDAVISKMEDRLGRKLSNNEVSVAVHRTRSRKLKGVTTEEVRQTQLDQMTAKEIDTLHQLQAAANAPVLAPKVDEAAALDFATAHVFERASVVPEEELLCHALIHGRGQVSLDALKKTVATDAEFVKVGGDLSTRTILTTELELIDTLNAGRDAFPAIAPRFQSSADLGDDQRQAVAHVLSSADQFTGFRGLAGAGKTTALKELSAALDKEGRFAAFVAPTAAATDVLRRDGFSEAMTLQKLLADPKEQERLAQGAVIVLDEAGLVGIDDMKRLFSLAVEKRARVVFSGDTGQHSGVARGDALRLLEEHSLYRFGQMDHIRRQRSVDYREVVELAARQRPQEAFDRLDALGNVVEPPKLYEAAAAAFLDARERGRSALLVAPTWGEIESVTEQVRARLKKDGTVSGHEETVPVFDSLGWTDAQKRQPSHYAVGQRIHFQQRSGLFRQNEEVEVVATKADGLQKTHAIRVRRGDGSEHVFRPRTGSSFDVGERREIAVAPGDQLLIQANRRLAAGSSGTLVNGQVVTVKAVKDGRITLDDGRALPANYRQFSHGYCVTSHASQSRTVDAVFLVASSRSAAAIHREQFYVSISRGRGECRIFTDDKELLRDRIERSTQRQAALDLVRDALAEHGLVPMVPRPIRRKKKASPRIRPLRPLPGLVRGRAPLRQRMAGISRSVFQTMADWSERVREVVQPVVERIVSLPEPKVKVPKIKQRIRGPRL